MNPSVQMTNTAADLLPDEQHGIAVRRVRGIGFAPSKKQDLLAKYKPTGNEDEDFAMLKSFLAQESVLDISRPIMFEKHKHGSAKAKDYVYREYMVRHRISLFALKLDKKVTDRISFDGEPDSIQSSVCAMCCMNREEYPKPKKTK